jgi:general secretion pathway protein C
VQLVDRIVSPLRPPAGGLRAGLASLGPTLVTLLFVVLLAAQLAALLWRALDAGAPPPAPVPAATGELPAVDLTAIVNAHLFGVASAAGDPASAPATSANLTLAGTLAGRDPEQGWAIIGAGGQSARVYATGSQLPGGARLVAVFPDRVILDRAGARESLVLPRISAGGATAAAYAAPGSAAPASLADSVRQLVAQDPSVANELIRPQPVFAGGTLRGYRVYPGRNRANFAATGLQPGDLVTAVNGAALNDPNRGPEILRGIGQGSAVTLTIERNGQPQQLNVDPSAIAQQLQQNPATGQVPTESSE